MNHNLSKMISTFQTAVALAAVLLPTEEFISFLSLIERESRELKIRVQREFSSSDKEHE